MKSNLLSCVPLNHREESIDVFIFIDCSPEDRNDVRDRFVSHYISVKEIRKL